MATRFKRNRKTAPPPEYSQAEWAIAALSVEVVAITFWANLSGLFSLAAAAVALAIPGIYIVRWVSRHREDATPHNEQAGSTRRRVEATTGATPEPAAHDSHSAHPNTGRPNVKRSYDTLKSPRPAVQRTIAVPVSAADTVVAALKKPSRQPDYLALAAQAGGNAKSAAKAGDLDAAWALYHEQKSLYLQHANINRWNAKDTLSLDALVHEDLADVLRLEKRHKEALPHILYWVAANRHRPIKRHSNKVRTYFNRCKLANTSIEDVEEYLSSHKGQASYSAIQKQTDIWIQGG